MNMRFVAPRKTPSSPLRRYAGGDPALWIDQLFAAKSVEKGGVIRRKITDVDKYVGRDVLLAEVERREFHAVLTGDQFVILCNRGRLQVLT